MQDRLQMISKLKNSRQSRESYIRSKLNILIPSQIRGLRLKYSFTQKELGEMADMKQARISAMERPGEAKFNIDTLVRLAAAFKVGLSIRFISFSEMLQWENDFSQDDIKVQNIEEDSDFVSPMATMNIADTCDLLRNLDGPYEINSAEEWIWTTQRGFKDNASTAVNKSQRQSGIENLFQKAS